MTKDEIIAQRTALKAGLDHALIIVCDNNFLFFEEKDIIIWDDNNERFAAIQQNTNHLSCTIRPYLITLVDYVNIQQIRVAVNQDNFDIIATSLGFTANDKAAALKKFGHVETKDFL